MVKKVAVLTMVLMFGLVVQAGAVTFTGSSGSLSASVDFTVSGSNLIVTLTNTSTADVLVPADILSAVFFTLNGDPALTSVSALIASGSTYYYDTIAPIPTDGNVGGEWAYVDGLSGAPGGADEGIGSAGFNLFGQANFNGIDLAPPPALDGINYGILSAGDNVATGNTGVTGAGGEIKNSVVFTLSGIPSGFDPSATDAITKISFQYGTALTEPNVPGGGGGGGGGSVPEPSTIVLLGAGLFGLGLLGKRNFKK